MRTTNGTIEAWRHAPPDAARCTPREIVLGEACWHLGGNSQPAHALLDLVRKGALILARPWPEHLAGT